MALNFDDRRRRFLRTTAAALPLRRSQSSDPLRAQIRPNTSFGPLKQIDAGLLSVGYAEVGPLERSCGPPSARLALRHS